MTAHTRRLAIGGVLGGLAVAVALWGPGTLLPAETGQRPSNQARGGAQALPDVPVIDLKLERLQRERELLPDATRNPFRFRAAPVASAPPPAPRPVAPPEPFVAPEPAGPPPPPPIPVRFLGILVVGGEQVAAFSDARGHTFYGKEGDIIEGRYRVLRIGPTSVELAHLDGRGRQTIRQTGP